MNRMDELLTVREVSTYLKLSRATIWRWCSEGRLPAFKVGRNWRVQRSAVEQLIKQSLESETEDSVHFQAKQATS